MRQRLTRVLFVASQPHQLAPTCVQAILPPPLPSPSSRRCTAVAAVLLGQRLLVANVGDSRAVLARGGKGERRRLSLWGRVRAHAACSRQ